MSFDPSAKLDTGMKAGEAVTRAAHWWDKIGRHEAAKIKNDGGIPSGVLRGLAWEALTPDEKLRVTKAWHHFHVRRPDILGIDAETAFKLESPERYAVGIVGKPKPVAELGPMEYSCSGCGRVHIPERPEYVARCPCGAVITIQLGKDLFEELSDMRADLEASKGHGTA